MQLYIRWQREPCKDMRSRPHLGPFHSTCRVQLCCLRGQSSASECLPRKVKGKCRIPSPLREVTLEQVAHSLTFQDGFTMGLILERTKKKKNQWGFCESITSYYIKLYRYQNSKGRERILLVSMNFKLSTNSVKMWESQFRYQEIYKQTLLSE